MRSRIASPISSGSRAWDIGLIVLAADRLLAREQASYTTLVALLEDVGRAWGTQATGHPDRRPVAFHTVLVVPAHRRNARADWGVAPLAG